ncbi:VWA domain-containing protein [Mycobacterium sp. ACS4331]|uniref:nitric oxide reductase activation protein NorD n=1 Tax=Mycobacterium sp. ACS4331 TaxID=1834121 RepID=UPI0009EECAC9|nr:VWA domain-containing protein [Mycobacterium sp. ACS4331]
MLASALAGRTVSVAAAEPGEPAWTDGTVVYVGAADSPGDQLTSVAVQASLLAAGSLTSSVVRRLRRRGELAARYLAVEGNRALATNEDLLPYAVRSLIDIDLARQTTSPAESLQVAKRTTVAAPPLFGTIRPRRLVAVDAAAGSSVEPAGHAPRKQASRELAGLDDADDDSADDDMMDPFSSPVGGGGLAGKLLQRMLKRVRKLSGGGSPGADTPTHRSPKGTRGAGAVISSASAIDMDSDNSREQGWRYPEWDLHRRRYRPDWCTVRETDPDVDPNAVLGRPDVHALRRPLTRLGIGLDRCHRQAQGDDIDVDAAVEARAELLAGSVPDEAVYVDSLRRRRDLAVLILLDVSGSAAEAGTYGQIVHGQQREAVVALSTALHELGDRVALYAFASQGRNAVNMQPVKRFDEHLDLRVLQRLASLVPGAYSRLGAAIRHGTAVIEEKGGTSRRLLVVLSDGLAYDHGYERGYGAADARRALSEARRRGVGCLCLTVGAATDSGELQQVFGSAAHAAIPRPAQVADHIGPLFRAALRTADTRRRVS